MKGPKKQYVRGFLKWPEIILTQNKEPKMLFWVRVRMLPKKCWLRFAGSCEPSISTSRRLVQSDGLTGPQAVVLKEVVRSTTLTSGELAKRVNLGQGTVSEIVKRLESRQLVKREQSATDRHRVHVSPTQAGCDLIAESPPLLQEAFSNRFSALKDWEQNLLLSSVQRVAELMDAEEIDAAPMLSSGSIETTPQAISAVVAPEVNDIEER